MPFLPGGDEGDRKRRPPGDWPASQQSSREFSLTIPKTGASHVPLPAHAKFAEVRFNPFVSVQSLQLRKALKLPSSVQTKTRRRSS